MRYAPGLDPLGKELGVDGGFDDGAVGLEERKKTSRVAHAVEVDEVLVTPVLAKRDSVCKAHVLLHAVAPARILRAAHGLGEAGIDEVRVQLLHANFDLAPLARALRLLDDNRTIRVGRVACHANEAVALVLPKESGRVAPTTSRRAAPEDQVGLFVPRRFHIVDVLDNHVYGVPAVGVLLRRRVVVVAGDHDVAEALALGGREDRVEHRDGAPVGKEVALLVARPRVGAEVELVVNLLREDEIFS